MASEPKCKTCPLSFYAYHWNRTRCKAYHDSLTKEQIEEMYRGYAYHKGVYIYPEWCPRMNYVHVKY